MHDAIGTIARVNSFRDRIFDQRFRDGDGSLSLSSIKRVIIINSASRSGSSLLYTLLRKLPQIYGLTGEAAPFYKLSTNLGDFNPHLSDTIPSEYLDDVIDLSRLSRDFIADMSLSELVSDMEQLDADGYCDDLVLRFVLQWPTIDMNSHDLRSCIMRAIKRYSAAVSAFNPEEFFLELLTDLTALWPDINPFYYDIGTDKVALHFPFLEIPCGPPNPQLTLEEPPFILSAPRRKPSQEDLSGKILLLKSTVDCYRMNLIEKIFSGAEIRIIHLVRNPAATINGLYDGWLHRGFFSHNLETCFDSYELKALNIKGYSDCFPFGRFWWNFDLPLGWQEFADRELVDVCAFQWHSANTQILNHLDNTHRQSCTIHFEDVIRSNSSRREQFDRLLEFMGIPSQESQLLGLDTLPVVQATLPPQLYRWKKRGDMISHVLSDSKIRDMAECFGYHPETPEEWL